MDQSNRALHRDVTLSQPVQLSLIYRRGVIPRRNGNYTYRLSAHFVPRCDQRLALAQIASSNAQRNHFNQH
jgi:hypothetical protein